MCLFPRLIKNPKYKPNAKNGGKPPLPLDDRVKYVPIGCQNCIECRKQKAREWQVRLLEDIKTHRNAKFITLTFNDQQYLKLSNAVTALQPISGYLLDNEIATLATRRFLERHRKQHRKALRHWLVTELGHNGTENIHLHGLIWTDLPLTHIAELWQYGFMYPNAEQAKQNFVNNRTVNYITKYVHKMDKLHPNYNSKILTSPGIGHNYTTTYDSTRNKFQASKTIETYRTSTGHKIAMPTYWRNKIYNEEQREKLWLQKLDKQVRYICGERIDISTSEKDYYETLLFYQNKNHELGYGNAKQDWEKKHYENERRAIMQKTRIEQAIKKQKIKEQQQQIQ